MTILIIVALVSLFALGTPIFAVMLGAGAYGATQTARGGAFLEDFGNQMADIVQLGTGEPAQILSTIPLFIFAGFLMAESRTADRVVRAAQACLGWLPGGLAIVTILACAVFTTFTGASGVTIVALGGLIMPSLLKEGYPQRFSLGLVAGTGSVGLLFPPALPLFIYGTVFGLAAQTQSDTGSGEMQLIEFSTDRFLFAGLVPGAILLGILSLFAVVIALVRRVPRSPFDVREMVRSTAVAIPEMLLPVIIIFGIVSGVSIPEIAALGVVYVFFLEVLLFRDLPISRLWSIVRASMALVGAIFIIIFAASALTNFFVTAEVPKMLFSWIKSTFESKWSFLFALNIFLLLVGMTMDIFSAIVVVVPLIAPVAMDPAYNIDPYHLGVIFLLNLELGYLTPPVGLNLFITGFTFKRPIAEVIRATQPFLLCMVIALALVTYIPALTVVPAPERRGRVGEISRDLAQAMQRLSAVRELTLPDGSALRQEDCDKLQGLDAEACKGVFVDATRCRAEGDATRAQACEEEVIRSYLELSGDGDDDEMLDDEWDLEGDLDDGELE